MIYLDNAATTRLNEYVLKDMIPYLTEQYGNPGSLHKLGFQAQEAVSEARQNVANFIGSNSDDIIFTSGGSEANSLAVSGIKQYLLEQGKTHIVVSAIEHHSVIEAMADMERSGFRVDYVSPDNTGVVSVEAVKELVREDTGLVCVMYVNNELGSENPVEEIGTMCRENGALFMCDAVQAAGTFNINVECLNCDLLTISSHKIYGPKGIGALYCRDKKMLRPIIYGGASQEYGLRGGTENVAAIVGFGSACKRMVDNLESFPDISTNLKREFMDYLVKKLDKSQVLSCMHVNADSASRRGKILSLTFDGVDSETLLLMLDVNGLCASAGSACNSKEQVPSHVLKAIGLTDEQARCTIRLSFSELNLFDNMEEAASIVASSVAALKSLTK